MTDVAQMRARLAELPKLYADASPNQRYKVARHRLAQQDSGPNHVSCTYRRSRDLHVRWHASSRFGGCPADVTYDRLRRLNAVALIRIRDHVATMVQRQPSDIFGPNDWELFGLAMDYRTFPSMKPQLCARATATLLSGRAAACWEHWPRSPMLEEACDHTMNLSAAPLGSIAEGYGER